MSLQSSYTKPLAITFVIFLCNLLYNFMVSLLSTETDRLNIVDKLDLRIEFLMNNFLASFDMKDLFTHTIMLLLIDLVLFQHYIVLTVLYCSTAKSV